MRMPLVFYRALMRVAQREGQTLSALVRSWALPNIREELRSIESEIRK